jgi:hypothetical protein
MKGRANYFLLTRNRAEDVSKADTDGILGVVGGWFLRLWGTASGLLAFKYV